MTPVGSTQKPVAKGIDAPREVRTALGTAASRAYHRRYDEQPPICDDPLAHRMLSEREYETWAATKIAQYQKRNPDVNISGRPEPELLATALRDEFPQGEILTRQRFNDDALRDAIGRGVRQYVVLGAGFDTYGLRNTIDELHVYELDQAVTQDHKLKRISENGLTPPPNLHFISVDFETEPLEDALSRSSFDRSSPAFVSWLGVTMYLSKLSCFESLRSTRRALASGSELVFDYVSADGFDEPSRSTKLTVFAERLAAIGSPLHENFRSSSIASDLLDCGFEIADHLGPKDVHERYLANRNDGYTAAEFCHFVRAVTV